jgi:sugar phosphate isomerase/epimerase
MVDGKQEQVEQITRTKRRVYISSSVSTKDNIKEALSELARLGFLDIELGGGTRYYEGLEGDILELKKRYGINFLIHNYFPPTPDNFVMNVAAKDPGLRKATFNHIKTAIRFAKSVDCDLYTLHPGFNRSLLKEKDRKFYEDPALEDDPRDQGTKEDFYRAIDLLADGSFSDGVRIGVENFFPFFTSVRAFMESAEDVMEFLERYKKEPRIGLLLDMGHMNVAAAKLGFDKFAIFKKIFSGYADKIFEIHVSENDGNRDMHRVSEPDSWQIELIRDNKKALGRVPVVFEWRGSLDAKTYSRFTELRSLLEN